MSEPTTQVLREKKCLPCEGGVPAIEGDEAVQYIKATPDWTLSDDAKSISRKVICKHFVEAMELMNRIAEVAEAAVEAAPQVGLARDRYAGVTTE